MRKWTKSGAVVAAALIAGSDVSAQTATPSLTIDGTSTLRSWTCEAGSFELLPSPREGFEEAVLKGEPALETVTVTFPVAAIECGNETMNEHMWKALKASDHPQIRYRLSRYAIARAESGVEVNAEGELTIAGTERPISMAVTVTRGSNGSIRVRGEQKVRMTDFGVTPPTLMLGTIKVGDAVTVKFDVPLRGRSAGIVADSNR